MFHLEFKKDTEKVVLLEVKGLIQVVVSSRLKHFVYVSINKTSF